jgi:hypothetical protein
VGQLGFYDLDSRLKALSAKGDPLEALEALVPFESFRAEIEAVVRLAPEERKSNAGRKPFDAVMMFKILVLPMSKSSIRSATGCHSCAFWDLGWKTSCRTRRRCGCSVRR